MKGKLVLIGASGTIGAATLAAARTAGLDVVPTFQSREIPGGVRFRLETDSLDLLGIAANDVLVVFAAHSDQEWVRTHAEEARALNVAATTRLAEEARRRKALVVFLSSEAVFGENHDTGWTETSPPCPGTEYGRQKFEMEQVLLSLGSACIVRTGWNVSSRATDRCVVRNTYESLLAGSARIAADNVFSLTDADDTARLLLQVAAERATGIVHAVSGVPVSRTAMADEIIRTSVKGKNMRYERIRFADLNFKEPKPASAWLQATGAINRRIPAFAPPLDVIARKVKFLDEAQI